MTATTFPTTVDDFANVEDTHLDLPRITSAIAAIETLAGIGAKSGAAITATGNLAIGDGKIRHIGSLSGNITLTPVTTGATAGDRILLVRTGTTAHTVAVGSLFTMPASTAGTLEIEYSGSAWVLVNVQLKPVSATVGPVAFVAPSGGATVTLTADLTRVGAHALTFTTSNTTDVTLPTTGTLASLDGTETLTNKRIRPKQGTIAWLSNACSITMASGSDFDIPSTSNASTITLADTGAATGDTVRITANGTANAHTVTVKDSASTTLQTMTANKMACGIFRFNGSKFRTVSQYQES